LNRKKKFKIRNSISWQLPPHWLYSDTLWSAYFIETSIIVGQSFDRRVAHWTRKTNLFGAHQCWYCYTTV